MALPAGIQTVTVNIGKPTDFLGNTISGAQVEFVPSTNLVWEADGTPLFATPIFVDLPTGTGSVVLPATDQSGFTDGNGNTVTNWTYSVQWIFSNKSVTAPGLTAISLPAATPTVDLDLLARVTSSRGSLVAVNAVTSVDGKTGSVDLSTEYVPLPTAGTATGYVPTVQSGGGIAYAAQAGGGGSSLAPTGTKTLAYTAAVNDLVLVDATTDVVTITLPNAPADKAQVAVKKMDSNSTNAASVQCAGTDTFDSGATSFGITQQYRVVLFQYKSSNKTWYPIGTYLTVSSLNIPSTLGDLSGTFSYDQAAPGAEFGVNWSDTNSRWQIGSSVITSRPSPRTDIVFHFIGGTTAPTFGLAGVDVWDKDAS